MLLTLASAGSWLASAPVGAIPGSFLSGLRLEVLLALVALTLASGSPLGMTARLGLAKGRLPWTTLLLLSVGTLSLSYALDGVYQLVPHADGAPERFAAELAGARGARLALALLCFALAPGIAEELLCRGLVQRGLEARHRPAVAIAAAALFFGVLHADPIYSLFAALLGLYLGTVAHLAGSVRASIACHATNNAVAVLWAASELDPAPAGPISIALSAGLSLLLLAGCWRRLPASPDDRAPPGSGRAGLQPKPWSDDA